jgi:lauroyl/myristoyl acyltransferase
MTGRSLPGRPPSRGLDASRRARPPQYSPLVWALMLALDVLPWPWGERFLAGVFVAKSFVQVSQLRGALRWASARSAGHRARWRLALATSAHHGRAVARSAIVGLRDPATLRPSLVLRGEEHLRSASGGVILLGFHLGMPNSDVALRQMGHRVRWMGGRRILGLWTRPAWQPYLDQNEDLVIVEGPGAQGGVLRRACRALLDGETLYVTADGGRGREAFRVPLPGAPMVVRAGWLTLREHTGATVLPVLAHREGSSHIVTIHPPLPADLVASAETLGRLLEEYTRRFPEQCYRLAFPPAGNASALAA